MKVEAVEKVWNTKKLEMKGLLKGARGRTRKKAAWKSKRYFAEMVCEQSRTSLRGTRR